LTGVFTYPAFRRQGYGGRIVMAGTNYIRASDADIAMLHCGDEVRGFYAKYGWEPLPSAQTFVGPRDHPQPVDEVLMMQFISRKGQRGKKSFVDQPIYFGSDSTW
jgi:GNAT superfamily N-acetyltransferase